MKEWQMVFHFIYLFDLILYVPVNNFSVMPGRVFLGWTSNKQGIKCLAQGHNAGTPLRLQPATPWSRVKNSTTDPLCSLASGVNLVQQSDLVSHHLRLAVRKPFFGGLWTTRVQTSLHICAVWSAPLLFAYCKVSYPCLIQAKFQFSS